MELLYQLRCLGYAEIGDAIWFPNLYFNALVKMNKITGKIEALEKFTDYNIRCRFLFSTAVSIEGYLVFIPNESREIISYHVLTGRYHSVSLDYKMTGKESTLFGNACVYNQYVYMFPTRSRYDVKSNSIRYLDCGIAAALRDVPSEETCFIMQYEMIDGKIYLPFSCINAIAVFDPDRETMDIKYLTIKGGCTTISGYKGKLYLASAGENRIYECDKQDLSIFSYPCPETPCAEASLYSYSAVIGEKIFFFPFSGGMILSMDAKTKEIREEYEIQNNGHEVGSVYYVGRSGERFLAITAENESFSQLCYENGKMRLIPFYGQDCQYNRKTISEYLLKHLFNEIQYEEEESLEECINLISAADISVEYNQRENCGSTIYNRLCDYRKGCVL